MPDTATATPTSNLIDEAAHRLPTFLGGEGIKLADGQVWCFPKPILEFCPRWAGSALTATPVTSLGREFDEAAVAFDKACEAANSQDPDYTGPTSLDAIMNLAVIMLRINYELSNDELSAILRWRPNDEESAEMWTSIQDVARGVAPKQKAGGSDSQ